MKKLLPLIILFSVFSYSQTGSLFNRTWYVYEISNQNGSQTLPKDPLNFPFVELNFNSGGLMNSSNEVMTNNCEAGFFAHITYSGSSNSDFSFDFVDFTPLSDFSNCPSNSAAMQNFMNDYIDFFQNSQTDTFSYFIQDVYGIDHLKITKPNGDYIWLSEFPYEYHFPPNEVSDNTWHLSKLVIDGEDINVPDLSNTGFNSITLDLKNYFNEYYNGISPEQTFITSGCSSTQGLAEFYTDSNTFYLYTTSSTLSECGVPEVNNFYNQYISVFLNHSPGPYTYQVVNDGDINYTLTITNEQGEKAVFNTNLLAANQQTVSDVLIYPNPVQDLLSVSSEKQIKYISIFDTLGKQILQSTNNQIDFSSVSNGCYVVMVQFNDDSKIYKKIVH